MPNDELRSALRAATAELHAETERRMMPLLAGPYDGDVASYVALLQLMLRWHQRWELAARSAAHHSLRYFLSLHPPRAQDCEADLRLLGGQPSELPPADPSALGDLGSSGAVGMLYVVEGAALGGAGIGQRLARAGLSSGAASFRFHHAGPSTAVRWKAYLVALERVPHTVANVAAAITGAKRAFESFAT